MKRIAFIAAACLVSALAACHTADAPRDAGELKHGYIPTNGPYLPGQPVTGGGTVTNVATGTGLTGGPITTGGTVALANTAVTPGAYVAPTITIDQQGRITAATNDDDNGSAPGLGSGCGSGATVSPGLYHFTITTATVGLGTCVATYATALGSAAPTCNVTSRNAVPVVYTANATTVSLSTGLVAGQLYDVACEDHH